MSNMQIRVSAVIVFLVLVSQVSFCQGRHTARSMVITKYGIVATSHTLASQAGAEILRRGGSAVDAAIAANATLGVIEPMMNGIGGDLFAIYWDAKTGKLYGINSSGWAPQGLTVAHLKAKDMTKMPLFGIDSVTVPGAVAGWNALYGKFGHMPWKDIFQPAIFYADQGSPSRSWSILIGRTPRKLLPMTQKVSVSTCRTEKRLASEKSSTTQIWQSRCARLLRRDPTHTTKEKSPRKS